MNKRAILNFINVNQRSTSFNRFLVAHQKFFTAKENNINNYL